jgi:tetratricopeptide (TPR) repeat protein
MGRHTRTITTESREAQKYFDQGLIWAYAFNHDEALRSFTKAAELDPDCAMAWWGVALCNGPHINNPTMPPERSAAAWDALQKAQARKDRANVLERALIDALAARYANPAPADRAALDQAYAAAMEKVWQKYRGDNDVAVLYVESLMDLQPWDLWTKDGRPKGRTTEIVAILEEVRSRDPNHPGANHLYIHAVEAGPQPEKGNDAADRLRNAVPAAGHLVHMPSHIDVQVGRWALAADQNARAAKADAKYRKLVPRQDFYRVYMAHNDHFRAFASMMEGRYKVARECAQDMLAAIPTDYVQTSSALVDPLMAIELDVLMRFGKWEEILTQPAPPAHLPITTCMWHFTRGVAYAATGRVPEAERELTEFRAATRNVPEGALWSINPAISVLAVAERVLEGEIEFRRGNIDKAVQQLRAAVAKEDELLYMEPPDWVQPARHTLGAVLISAGRYSDAEQVYREDLEIWPENGWSLYGLSVCLRARGATREAQEVERRFRKSWARADTKIDTSCLCTSKAH